eukprot:gene11033-biopygen13248
MLILLAHPANGDRGIPHAESLELLIGGGILVCFLSLMDCGPHGFRGRGGGMHYNRNSRRITSQRTDKPHERRREQPPLPREDGVVWGGDEEDSREGTRCRSRSVYFDSDDLPSKDQEDPEDLGEWDDEPAQADGADYDPAEVPTDAPATPTPAVPTDAPATPAPAVPTAAPKRALPITWKPETELSNAEERAKFKRLDAEAPKPTQMEPAAYDEGDEVRYKGGRPAVITRVDIAGGQVSYTIEFNDERIDAQDGKAYTKQQFINKYGRREGRREWDEAGVRTERSTCEDRLTLIRRRPHQPKPHRPPTSAPAGRGRGRTMLATTVAGLQLPAGGATATVSERVETGTEISSDMVWIGLVSIGMLVVMVVAIWKMGRTNRSAEQPTAAPPTGTPPTGTPTNAPDAHELAPTTSPTNTNDFGVNEISIDLNTESQYDEKRMLAEGTDPCLAGHFLHRCTAPY